MYVDDSDYENVKLTLQLQPSSWLLHPLIISKSPKRVDGRWGIRSLCSEVGFRHGLTTPAQFTSVST